MASCTGEIWCYKVHQWLTSGFLCLPSHGRLTLPLKITEILLNVALNSHSPNQEEFEDTKRVIRICKSKKNRQHNYLHYYSGFHCIDRDVFRERLIHQLTWVDDVKLELKPHSSCLTAAYKDMIYASCLKTAYKDMIFIHINIWKYVFYLVN